MKGSYSVRMIKRLRRTKSRIWSSNLTCSGLAGPVNSLPCPAFCQPSEFSLGLFEPCTYDCTRSSTAIRRRD